MLLSKCEGNVELGYFRHKADSFASIMNVTEEEFYFNPQWGLIVLVGNIAGIYGDYEEHTTII